MHQSLAPRKTLRTLLGGYRRDMLAGLLDAGFASLATFLVGIFAVRMLDPVALGGYALAYQSLFLFGIVPAYLVLTPAEVAVVAHPAERRLAHLRRSISLGAPVALAAAFASAVWIVVAPAEISAETIRALVVTSVTTAFLSPMQDHVRHMLHSSGRSWKAAGVSIVQFVSALAGIGALTALDAPPAWIPFGALGLANLVSLTYGMIAARTMERSTSVDRLHLRELVAAGRWIFGGAILNPAAGFAAAAIVSRLAGAEALGYAEGARVVAQPVWVMAVGLSYVLGPRSMEAGRSGQRERGRAISRSFIAVVGLAGLGCMALFGAPWEWNPLLPLLPTAYAIEGLTLLMLLAQTVNGLYFAQRSELLGARREAALTKTELATSGARVAVATSAPLTHAYAIPLAYLAVGLVRGFAYRRLLARLPTPAPESAKTT